VARLPDVCSVVVRPVGRPREPPVLIDSIRAGNGDKAIVFSSGLIVSMAVTKGSALAMAAQEPARMAVLMASGVVSQTGRLVRLGYDSKVFTGNMADLGDRGDYGEYLIPLESASH
jgi:hypothetical protein